MSNDCVCTNWSLSTLFLLKRVSPVEYFMLTIFAIFVWVGISNPHGVRVNYVLQRIRDVSPEPTILWTGNDSVCRINNSKMYFISMLFVGDNIEE